MFNDELDMLEIHLNTTWDSVDWFVLIEGVKTFTGLNKPLILRRNLNRSFTRYASKIIYKELAYPPDFEPISTWDIEDFQRNAMLNQVFPALTEDDSPHARARARAPRHGDVIVVSDVDEIPRPETLDKLRACRFPRRLTLRSKMYHYGFQFLRTGAGGADGKDGQKEREWPHPQATYYQGPRRTVQPNDLRMGLGFFATLWWDRAEIGDAAWHCSSCFATMQALLNKMNSFSHTLLNEDRFRDRRRMADRVRAGLDLWDRDGENLTRIEGNEDVPSFVLDNRVRFAYLLNRDGESAGFIDYYDG